MKTMDISVSGMAENGVNNYTYILRITEEGIDTGKNCSVVTVQAIMTQSLYGTGFSGNWAGVSCTVNGQSLFSDYQRRTLSGREEHVFYTWTGELPHDRDGYLTLTVGGKFWISPHNVSTPPDMVLPETVMELTPISRASQVGAEDAPIEGRTTVVITPVEEGLTHYLQYRFGELSGYITADGGISDTPALLTGTTVSFLLPEAFYGQIPNDPWGQCQLECTTYRGEQLLGTAESAFRVTAQESRCGPLVELELWDINEATLALTADPHVAVRYMSVLRCRPIPQARGGATITACQVAGVPAEDYVDLAGVQSGVVTCQVWDSRGYTASVTRELPLIPYVKLTNNARVARTAPTTGRAILTFSGNCYSGSFGAAENTLTVSYRLCPEDGSFGPWQQTQAAIGEDHTYFLSLELTDLDYTKAYTLQTQVLDLLDTAQTELTVQQGIPVFHWDRDRFYFHVPVACDGAVSGAYICSHDLYGQDRITLTLQPGQTVFLFGGPVWGTVGYDGQWQGSAGVMAQVGPRVILQFPQPISGKLLLISTGQIHIEEGD